MVVVMLSKREMRSCQGKGKGVEVGLTTTRRCRLAFAACWVRWAAAARERQGESGGQRASQFFLHARGCGGGNHQILSASAGEREIERDTPEPTHTHTHPRTHAGCRV